VFLKAFDDFISAVTRWFGLAGVFLISGKLSYICLGTETTAVDQDSDRIQTGEECFVEVRTPW
jgi:hypothetical protein